MIRTRFRTDRTARSGRTGGPVAHAPGPEQAAARAMPAAPDTPAAPAATDRVDNASRSSHASLTLADLARRRMADTMVIDGLDEAVAAPGLRRRLLETGFTAGCPVRFVIATPFGDPLVFSLRGTSIALRRSEAACVRVRAERAS